MSLFSKLLGVLRGGSRPAEDAGRNAFWIYVRCDACGESIRVRVNREHDLSAEFDEGSDAPASFHVHKEIVGQNCFRRIQVDMTFDQQRRVTDQQIRGGTFLTSEAYVAAVAGQGAEKPESPAPPSASA